MLDTNAPIIPGKSAGDVEINATIEDVLKQAGEIFEIEYIPDKHIGDLTKYRSKDIDIWVRNNKVWQIVVHGNYLGKVLDSQIGLGSTLRDVKNYFGDMTLLMENIMVKTLPGMSFEPETEEADAKIAEIYIWKPILDELRELSESPSINFPSTST